MKSALATREIVLSVDEAETGKFTIADTAQAFQVLIDGLYSDKILAVIRELWSNAFDAHVAVGTPERAFDCELPTVFNPVFSVRDYGISLNHTDTMGLYTTIFKSSKEGTNTQVGKFGLGSKSPFAYEDTFSVTTWNTTSDFTTEQRDYTCFIGEDGVPRITMMNVQESDEPRGLKVSFPVKVKDVDAFAERAEKVAIGFAVKPNMIGRDCDFAELEVVMEDPGLWQLCTSNSDVFQEGMAYARQGCVIYPINADSIPGIKAEQAAALRSPFIIDFPIGDLDITASRETLSYKGKTCRNILEAADIIIEEVRSRFSAEMKAAPSHLEACRLFMNLQSGSLHESLKKLLLDGLTWRGRKLSSSISLERVMRHPYVKGKVHVTKWDGTRAYRARRTRLRWESSSYVILNVGSMPVIYLEDTSKRGQHVQGKINYHFDCLKREGKASSMLWVRTDAKGYAFKRLLAAMGKPSQIIDAHSLPKPPPDQKGYIKKPTRMQVMLPGERSFHIGDVYEEEDYYYVDMERGQFLGLGTRGCNSSDVANCRNKLIDLGMLPANVQLVAVPRTCKTKINRNKHWKRFWDMVAEIVTANYDPIKTGIAKSCKELVNEEEFSIVRKLIDEDIVLDHEDKSMMHKLRTVYERVQKRGEENKVHLTWYELSCQVNYNTPVHPHKVRWQPLAQKVQRTYPMLKLLGNYVSSKDLPTVVEYVNLVDRHA